MLGTAERIAPHLRPGQLVVLESTTWPGTTEDELAPRLARDDLRIGHELFLGYSPEREDPANPHDSTCTIPRSSAITPASPACWTR